MILCSSHVSCAVCKRACSMPIYVFLDYCDCLNVTRSFVLAFTGPVRPRGPRYVCWHVHRTSYITLRCADDQSPTCWLSIPSALRLFSPPFVVHVVLVWPYITYAYRAWCALRWFVLVFSSCVQFRVVPHDGRLLLDFDPSTCALTWMCWLYYFHCVVLVGLSSHFLATVRRNPP